MVYIADASIQVSNTANVYKIINSFSLGEAWIKGLFHMCKVLKGKVISLPVIIVRWYESDSLP